VKKLAELTTTERGSQSTFYRENERKWLREGSDLHACVKKMKSYMTSQRKLKKWLL